jgi:hypothetical protein
MTDNLDNFGAGVFDDPPAETGGEEQSVSLSDREIAIAKGEDPDQVVEESEVAEEQESEPVAEDSQSEITEVAEESSQSEEASDQEQEAPQDPFSLGDRKLAERYGFTEVDIQKFGTPEALHHALEIIDRSNASSQRSEDSLDSSESPVSDSAEDAAAKSEGGTLSELLGYEKLDVSKFEDSDEPYDEETLTLVKHVRKTEDMLERITGMLVQNETSQNDQIFHDTLDSYPDLYGNSIKDGVVQKLDDKFQDARQAVKDQAEIIYAGIVAKKGAIPPVNQIIEQAVMAVHGKQVSSKPETSGKSEKLKKQSAKRRSPGSTSASSRRQAEEIDPTSAESIARHPEIEALWRRSQEASGAV